ncbi:MAG: type 4a pilus biogenesis protein PilO [Candidatus Omnitrophota bacterium]
MNPGASSAELGSQKIKEILSDKNTQNAILIVFLVLSYMLVLFLPKAKAIVRNASQAAKVKVEIVKLEKDWAGSSAIEQRINQLNEKIDFYEKELPGEKEVPAVLRYLSESARKLNVKITEIKPADQNEIPGEESSAIYFSVPILLKAECGYHQLGRFISDLESADRFMKISDIKIMQNSTDPVSHYVRLTVVTYVLRQ